MYNGLILLNWGIEIYGFVFEALEEEAKNYSDEESLSLFPDLS